MILSAISTRAPKEWDKSDTKEKTQEMLEKLNDLQNILYAQSTYSVLVVLQGMDASGKDGAIRNVFGGFNPQGVRVQSFKKPTEKELSHDFLWRVHEHTPQKGMIQIFNRSHYEDILVTRVNNIISDETAYKRMQAINDFEKLLMEHNNTVILKFYLHISKEEQHERFLERLEDKTKNWKYNKEDADKAKDWDKYMQAYEECFAHCNQPQWIIVPADQNWVKEFVITSALLDKMKTLNLEYPSVTVK